MFDCKGSYLYHNFWIMHYRNVLDDTLKYHEMQGQVVYVFLVGK